MTLGQFSSVRARHKITHKHPREGPAASGLIQAVSLALNLPAQVATLFEPISLAERFAHPCFGSWFRWVWLSVRRIRPARVGGGGCGRWSAAGSDPGRHSFAPAQPSRLEAQKGSMSSSASGPCGSSDASHQAAHTSLRLMSQPRSARASGSTFSKSSSTGFPPCGRGLPRAYPQARILRKC